MEKNTHIRPTIKYRRKTATKEEPPTLSQSENVDDILERTRRKMAEILTVSTKAEEVGGIKSKSASSSGTKNIIEPKPSSIIIKDERLLGGDQELGSVPHDSSCKQPKGILKHNLRYDDRKKSKDNYSCSILPVVAGETQHKAPSIEPAKKKHNAENEAEAYQRKIERASLAQEMGLMDPDALMNDPPENNANEKPVVKDFVTERTVPKADPYPDPNGVEGKTIEADLEFSCMSEMEYEEIRKLVKSRRSRKEMLNEKNRYNITEEGKDVLNDEGNESDGSRTSAGDENDEGVKDMVDMLDFFAQEEEEEDHIDAQATPSPFVILWNVLANWITSEAVQRLREWRRELFSDDYIEPVVKEHLETEVLSHRSDITCSDVGLSRRAGLMAMLKMNISAVLSELGYKKGDGNVTNKFAESRLGEFIETFDLDQPMVKLDSDMWAALTTVLLEIVLPRKKSQPDSKHSTLPLQLQKVGLTIEEYRYLTCSAIPSMYHCTQ